MEPDWGGCMEEYNLCRLRPIFTVDVTLAYNICIIRQIGLCDHMKTMQEDISPYLIKA